MTVDNTLCHFPRIHFAFHRIISIICNLPTSFAGISTILQPCVQLFERLVPLSIKRGYNLRSPIQKYPYITEIWSRNVQGTLKTALVMMKGMNLTTAKVKNVNCSRDWRLSASRRYNLGPLYKNTRTSRRQYGSEEFKELSKTAPIMLKGMILSTVDVENCHLTTTPGTHVICSNARQFPRHIF